MDDQDRIIAAILVVAIRAGSPITDRSGATTVQMGVGEDAKGVVNEYKRVLKALKESNRP